MLRLSLLGPVELTREDGTSVQSVLAQPKRVALLAYLALANPGGFCRRDTLLALFWPESDEAHARRALNQALYFLRRSLGDEVIVSRGDEEVGLNSASLTVDAIQLGVLLTQGRVEEAASLYRGELLEGFHADASVEFDHWAERQRHRLRDQAARAHANRTGAAVADWDGERIVKAAASSPRRRWWRGWRIGPAIGAGAALLSGSVLIFAVPALWSARGPGVDEDLVLVLPARLPHSSDSLHHLRDGVLDLVAARWDGSVGLRALDPRAWGTADNRTRTRRSRPPCRPCSCRARPGARC